MRAQRDLLVLTRKSLLNKEQLETEMQLLDTLLYGVEDINVICNANEIINVNRGKVITNVSKVSKVLLGKVRPFVFVSNKN